MSDFEGGSSSHLSYVTACISFLQVGHCINQSITSVLISGGAGFSSDKVRGVSVVQHGHLTPMQLDAMIKHTIHSVLTITLH